MSLFAVHVHHDTLEMLDIGCLSNLFFQVVYFYAIKLRDSTELVPLE